MMTRPAAALLCIALAPLSARAAGVPADCSAAAIPKQTVQGRIGAAAFVPEDVSVSAVNHPGLNGVTYDAYDLRFEMHSKAGKAMYIEVTTIVPQGQTHEGKTFRMLPTKDTPRQPMAGPGAPEVQGWAVQFDPDKMPASFVSSVASLRIEYGTRTGATLPGRIYFCTPAAKGSVLAGNFEADLGE